MGLLGEPIERVCVSVPNVRVTPDSLGVAPDPTIRAARRALADGVPPGRLDPRVLVSYVPPAPADGDRVVVRAAAAVDPADPRHGWLVTEVVTPRARSDVPLHLTALIDVSDSMFSAPFREVPLLQDQPPPSSGPYVPTQRLAVARGVLDALAARLPPRATLSVVAFDARSGVTLLRPTPAFDRARIRGALDRVTQEAARAGNRSPLDAATEVATAGFDPCADHRVVVVTDDDARLSLDADAAAATVAGWRALGVEVWTLSLAVETPTASRIDRLTAGGAGLSVYADTQSEAVEALEAALRASGTVARDPSLTVAAVPGAALQLDGADAPTHTWSLPPQLGSGWSEVRLYELTLTPGATAAATVRWEASSPAPGEWTQTELLTVPLVAFDDAPAYVRERVFAHELAGAFAGEVGWAEVEALGARAVDRSGPARELQAWARLGRATAARTGK
ncbi:MAG: hypothetical protein ABMA64_31160 [Myxococcota bacterium]